VFLLRHRSAVDCEGPLSIDTDAQVGRRTIRGHDEWVTCLNGFRLVARLLRAATAERPIQKTAVIFRRVGQTQTDDYTVYELFGGLNGQFQRFVYEVIRDEAGSGTCL